MTTTSVDDAIILPQSQGTGLSGEESVIDAAINGVLNRYVGGEYVASEYSTGLAFQNHDGTNDTVEVGPGIVFVQDNSSSTSGERGSGGNPQAESSTTSGYDTELPEGHTYAVLLPTATEISVSDSTLNEVYVDIDDVTANNSVNLEYDGSTTASPGNTSLKIGETNPDDASADTRANDDPTFDSLTVNNETTTGSLTVNGTTTTDALNATNQSQVEASLSSDKLNNSAGTNVNIVDTEVTDKADIFNSSFEIEPNENGKYQIEAYAFVSNGSSGDRIALNIINNSTNNILFEMKSNLSSSGEGSVGFNLSFDLVAGDKYEVRVTNQDSSFDLSSTDRFTELEVYRRTAQP